MALITAAEVIQLVSPRNIDAGNITDLDITVAERDYIATPLGSVLYAAILANLTTYAGFITNYIKPVLAYGVWSNNFNRLKVEITDRGINQFTGEGITNPGTEQTEAVLYEIRQRLSSCIGAMIDYADETYPTLYDSTIDYYYNEVNATSQQPKRMNAL